jgi:hypothetical protein
MLRTNERDDSRGSVSGNWGSGRDFQSAGWIFPTGMALPKVSLKRRVELTRATLVPQLEALGQRAITGRVVTVDVVQQASTSAYHHEQAAP